MPKAILEFDLPEETEDFQYAVKGSHFACVIDELDNFLRAKLKYEELTDEQDACYQAVRDKLWELKNE